MFRQNMSGFDRSARLLLAFFLIAFAITGKIGNWGWIFGLILLVTGAVGRCPMYALLGWKPKTSISE
jgi:Protein of unknown function (DUF2892)